MPLIRVLIGMSLLVSGRQLFWFFVAAVGFVFGMDVAAQSLRGASPAMITLIALAAGAVGALLAYVLQGIVILVSGFIAGGHIATMIVALTAPGIMSFEAAFVIGGVIGAILLGFLFDWALIVLSSLFGADLLTEAANFSPTAGLVLFFAAALAGIILQATIWRGRLSS